MKKKNTNKIDITINKNRDDVELGEEAVNITTENGVKLKIPYDKIHIENTSRIASFGSALKRFFMNRKND